MVVTGPEQLDGDDIFPGGEQPLVYVDLNAVFILPLPALLGDLGTVDGELHLVNRVLCGSPEGSGHGGRIP